MWAFVARRLVTMLPTLLGVSIIIFVILRVVPGDPALILAGTQADPQTVANIRRDLGTDRPLAVQYLNFITGAAQGDLGRSFSSRRPVAQEVFQRFPRTLLLAVTATALATVGLLPGIVAAARQNSWLDSASMLVAVIGLSVPGFWLGLMLIYVFAIRFPLLPAVGLDSARSLILPSVVLSLTPLALIARMTRATMLDVLRQDYIRTAHSKGMAERTVLVKHAVKNAFIPVVTVIGLALGILMGTAVIVEIVFAIDGLGRLLVTGILARDFPIVQGAVLVMAVVFVLINLALDICYACLDPRIRFG
ncbi:MAG: ABC transporter permease [Armatimonadetes bacterium]|nr:ABC transporter permease [Armatimonadota bacterium]